MSLDESARISILFRSASLLCQTLCYGIYVPLIPFLTYIMLKQGLETRARRLLFTMMIFMFTLCTAYWAVCVYDFIQLIKGAIDTNGIDYLSLSNAIVLVNYVLTDAVVVWRAWVICKQDFQLILKIAIALLLLTTLSIAVTIGIRIIMTIRMGEGLAYDMDHLNRAIDCSQITNIGLTLLTNIVATSMIGVKTWRHRRYIREELNMAVKRRSKAEKVLTLLIESGLLYCLSAIVVLVASLIRLPSGTLGDIYVPVSVQTAGIYPTVVLIMVAQQQTMDETTFFSIPGIRATDGGRSQVGSIRFEARAIVSSQMAVSSSIRQ